MGNDKNFMRYNKFYPQNRKVFKRTKHIQASDKFFKISTSAGNRASADKVF